MSSFQFDKRWLAVGAAALALCAGLLFPRPGGVSRTPALEATVPPQLSVTNVVSSPTRMPQGISGGVNSSPEAPATPGDSAVYVCGAVKKPGVYRFAAGARVVDAVALAGGALPDADLDQINLAQPLNDAMKVMVPRKGQVLAAAEPYSGEISQNPYQTHTTRSRRHSGRSSAHKLQPGQSLDVNTATADELTQLPGVGPSLAQRIIDYRQQNGPFQTADDLQNVPGIGPSKFEKLVQYVRL